MAALQTLFAGLDEADGPRTGLTAKEIIDLSTNTPEDYPSLAEAVALLAGGRDGRPNARSLAMRMKHFRRKVIGGRYLDFGERNHTGIWYVRESG